MCWVISLVTFDLVFIVESIYSESDLSKKYIYIFTVKVRSDMSLSTCHQHLSNVVLGL
jgi:hypothetical protein